MIRVVSIVLVLFGSVGALQAREYQPDPFKDGDFRDKPILLKKAHTTRRRLELGAMFTTSIVEKYTRHMGAIATIDYHILDQLSIQLYGGYLGSKYTPIVTSQGGILGMMDSVRNPNVPDRLMMTFVVDAVLVFSPIYGKLNLVSEASFGYNLYFLLGAGVNGARTLEPTSPDVLANYNMQNVSQGVKFNFQWGFGFKFFLTDWMALRIEYRDIDYIDTFHDELRTNDQFTYLIMNHMFHAGVSFFPF